jgi:hypothetical protein
MKTARQVLKIKPHFMPFAASFSDIDSQNVQFTIGVHLAEEDVFALSDTPEYIKILCDLKPIKEFDSEIKINATYAPIFANEQSVRHMSSNVYSSEMSELVSAIEIHAKSILPDDRIPEAWFGAFHENQIIYVKRFSVLRNHVEARLEKDIRYETNAYNNLVSRAYPLAGIYRKGIPIPDIEQYFVFCGTGLQAKEYIQRISSKQLLSAKFVKVAQGTKASEITSLEDDISLGKIEIMLPSETKYKSVNVQKNTVLSDICTIMFKKEPIGE